jgi:hypothetical protein
MEPQLTVEFISLCVFYQEHQSINLGLLHGNVDGEGIFCGSMFLQQ